jgi:NADH:ubiquinone oxidoreductase subunit 6 (subunit J)
MIKFKKRLAQFILIIFALLVIYMIIYSAITLGLVYVYVILGGTFLGCSLLFAITHFDD